MGKALLSQAIKLEDVRRQDMYRRYLAQQQKGDRLLFQENKGNRKGEEGGSRLGAGEKGDWLRFVQ
ncbi:hypothetical protein [Desulfoscipio geothermicus]|uniref:Uncharacterized protein n=1 Tax=Desulfoscipio geothermicus DSM 3669 TaxID=1121426 RepID=A0A1I6DE95_9FIRM|nr:hypothetical protein [Desulfoscipio geothermicus]SFR03717.1 hypothetical protein SAMN05660706_10981 [Desulfoscipio geothermicus DSM 3669]